MDRLMSLAKYQVDRMKDFGDNFYLLNDEPECVNVCFWYIPPRLRDVPHSKEKEAELGKVKSCAGLFSQIYFPVCVRAFLQYVLYFYLSL